MTTTDTTTETAKNEAAESIVRKHVMLSMGGGLIPLPGVDVVAVTSIQLLMLRSLSKEYGVKFTENLGKHAIAGLVGGVGSASVASGGLGTLIKAVPLVGPILGGVTYSAVAGGTTYAIGQTFIAHFESGGTLLNFNAGKMKAYFKAAKDDFTKKEAAEAAGETAE